MRSFRYNHPSFLNTFEDVATRIDNLLEIAVVNVGRRLKAQSHMQEPDYTAAIATEFPCLMNRTFGYSHWRLGSSFTHQRPYVSFKSSNGNIVTCELGDLLFICHKREDGKDLYNAALMQLKRNQFHRVHEIVRPEELVQLELYEHWPSFQFKYYAGTSYNILPKAPGPGAQYLFINRLSPLFTHAIPSAKMAIDEDWSLGRFLVAFTNWQTGRPISPEDDPEKDDWSRAIWTIVAGNRNAVYNRRNVGKIEVPRNSGSFLEYLTSTDAEDMNEELLSLYTRGELKTNPEAEEYPNIPILFIEV